MKSLLTLLLLAAMPAFPHTINYHHPEADPFDLADQTLPPTPLIESALYLAPSAGPTSFAPVTLTPAFSQSRNDDDDEGIGVTIHSVQAPEPSNALLMGAGLLMLSALRRRP